MLAIGDIHGDPILDRILPIINDYDKIIIMGDYVDDFTNSPGECWFRLKELIRFKKENMEKIILLIGNHDIQYILFMTTLADSVRCSGFSENYAFQLCTLFNENLDLFKVAHMENNTLYTHAGISFGAFQEYFKNKWEMYQSQQEGNFADFLNLLWDQLDGSLFYVGYIRGGSYEFGSIFWADMDETSKDFFNLPFNQVVGHTPVNDIIEIKEDGVSINYVDTRLGTKNFYTGDKDVPTV